MKKKIYLKKLRFRFNLKNYLKKEKNNLKTGNTLQNHFD